MSYRRMRTGRCSRDENKYEKHSQHGNVKKIYQSSKPLMLHEQYNKIADFADVGNGETYFINRTTTASALTRFTLKLAYLNHKILV